MTNAQLNPNFQNPKKYDLEDRTMKFSKDIIDFVRKIPESSITKPLIGQLIRSGTSVGANYCEADEASSKKDFINKLCISKKELKETKYWLELIAHNNPILTEEVRLLWKEAHELNLILATIIRKCKDSLKS